MGQHAPDASLAQALARRFTALSREESLTCLQAAGVPCAPVMDGQSQVFLDDPHPAANDMVATHQHPVLGQMRLARHYVRFGHTATVPGRPTPLLGEHTRQVLQEVGYSEPAIAALYTKGVVQTEEGVPRHSA
jgi:crotonobetainyl-CoA:carnitine CoA-transferase CaiB-like acyl-CoA transferase